MRSVLYVRRNGKHFQLRGHTMNNWKYVALLLVVLPFISCRPLTSDEREYNRVERTEQWRICEAVLVATGTPIYSEHQHSKIRRHKDWMIQEDLINNQCRELLRRNGLWE